MTDNDNIELKKRSRRRLVGAAALALLAAIVLPMVMDDEPGLPVQDIQITIPDRSADSRPIGTGALQADPVTVPTPQEQPESVVEFESRPETSAEPAPESPSPTPEMKVATPSPASPPSPPRPQPSPQEAQKPPAVAEEAERVRAILEGKLAAAASEASFVVQVGAFGDAVKATVMRDELSGQGFRAFTEEAGAVTRVRLGPYASRDEAEKVAERLRTMGIGGVVQSR